MKNNKKESLNDRVSIFKTGIGTAKGAEKLSFDNQNNLLKKTIEIPSHSSSLLSVQLNDSLSNPNSQSKTHRKSVFRDLYMSNDAAKKVTNKKFYGRIDQTNMIILLKELQMEQDDDFGNNKKQDPFNFKSADSNVNQKHRLQILNILSEFNNKIGELQLRQEQNGDKDLRVKHKFKELLEKNNMKQKPFNETIYCRKYKKLQRKSRSTHANFDKFQNVSASKSKPKRKINFGQKMEIVVKPENINKNESKDLDNSNDFNKRALPSKVSRIVKKKLTREPSIRSNKNQQQNKKLLEKQAPILDINLLDEIEKKHNADAVTPMSLHANSITPNSPQRNPYKFIGSINNFSSMTPKNDQYSIESSPRKLNNKIKKATQNHYTDFKSCKSLSFLQYSGTTCRKLNNTRQLVPNLRTRKLSNKNLQELQDKQKNDSKVESTNIPKVIVTKNLNVINKEISQPNSNKSIRKSRSSVVGTVISKSSQILQKNLSDNPDENTRRGMKINRTNVLMNSSVLNQSLEKIDENIILGSQRSTGKKDISYQLITSTEENCNIPKVGNNTGVHNTNDLPSNKPQNNVDSMSNHKASHTLNKISSIENKLLPNKTKQKNTKNQNIENSSQNSRKKSKSSYSNESSMIDDLKQNMKGKILNKDDSLSHESINQNIKKVMKTDNNAKKKTSNLELRKLSEPKSLQGIPISSNEILPDDETAINKKYSYTKNDFKNFHVVKSKTNVEETFKKTHKSKTTIFLDKNGETKASNESRTPDLKNKIGSIDLQKYKFKKHKKNYHKKDEVQQKSEPRNKNLQALLDKNQIVSESLTENQINTSILNDQSSSSERKLDEEQGNSMSHSRNKKKLKRKKHKKLKPKLAINYNELPALLYIRENKLMYQTFKERPSSIQKTPPKKKKKNKLKRKLSPLNNFCNKSAQFLSSEKKENKINFYKIADFDKSCKKTKKKFVLPPIKFNDSQLENKENNGLKDQLDDIYKEKLKNMSVFSEITESGTASQYNPNNNYNYPHKDWVFGSKNKKKVTKINKSRHNSFFANSSNSIEKSLNISDKSNRERSPKRFRIKNNSRSRSKHPEQKFLKECLIDIYKI